MTGANTMKDLADKYSKQSQAKCITEANTPKMKSRMCARRKIEARAELTSTDLNAYWDELEKECLA